MAIGYTKKAKLSQNDIIIAVMGPTGSGKSQFISTATKQKGAGVGHTLRSHTAEIQITRCMHPRYPDRSIVFVDTPSFNGTDLSDAAVLEMIASWLQKTYEHDIKLSGIIYTHRITDNRMAGSPLRNLRLFENLCGEDAVSNVLLATTMWNERIRPETGELRERELIEKYWKSMLDNGSRTTRFLGTYESAWEVVDKVTGRFSSKLSCLRLLVQKELVDERKPLMKTKAGMALQHDVQWMIADYKAHGAEWGGVPRLGRFRGIFT